MTVPLMLMVRAEELLSKVAPTSWLTQVKAASVPLFCQFAVLVSQTFLLRPPFHVAVASIPVCKLAGLL